MTMFLKSDAITAALRWSGGFALMLALTAAANGQTTVAYWDFEDGVDGQEFTPLGAENGSGGSVDTANAILMRGFNEQYGPAWTSDTSDGNGLAMDLAIGEPPNTTSDGYVTEGALHNWSPTAWTIEAHVYFDDPNGWRTLIGRDGSSLGDLESDFYIQNNGIDNKFRVNYESTTGQRWILDDTGPYGLQAGVWYGIVAQSDGQTLSLWVDDGFSDGHQLAASLDISSQSAADNAPVSSALNWTFGRGWYNGSFVDHTYGIMDNIRLTEGALTPAEFLPVDGPGAASSLSLVVNPDTGEASLRNDTDSDLSFDYYRVDSGAGDLSTGAWDSLADQGVDSVGPNPGDSWSEATNANSANLLVEQFLAGDSTLAPGQSIAIGSPYAGSGSGDLKFGYAATGADLIQSGVIYSTISLEGDFNDDGKVDAADYTLWRDGNVAADHSLNGVVDQADYNIWAANYGSVAALSTSVPEPVSIVLVSLGGLVATLRRRR